MTRPSLSPEALERLRRLELLVGAFVESVSSGKHASRGFGTSAHFADHRDYHPGEDPRAIDWRASARGDRLVVKRFEREGRLDATLILDASASMHFAGESDSVTKVECGALLLESLARVILANGDAVSVERVAFGDASATALRGGREQLEAVLSLLAIEEPSRRGECLADVLRAVLSRAQTKRLVVVASDLLEENDEWLAAAFSLVARGHRLVMIHTLTREETELSLSGLWRLTDCESDVDVEVDVDLVREAYVRDFGEWRASLEGQLSAAGVLFRTAFADADPVATVEDLLVMARAFWR
jgi:uncharacterized protein (DUF58 family)